MLRKKNTVTNFFVMLLLLSIVFTSVFSVAVKAETLEESAETGKKAELDEITRSTETTEETDTETEISEPTQSVGSGVMANPATEITDIPEASGISEIAETTESEDLADSPETATDITESETSEEETSDSKTTLTENTVATEESITAESNEDAQSVETKDSPIQSRRSRQSQVTRYIYANSIIRSAPNGSPITTLKMPLFVQGTIEGAWLRFSFNGATAYVANSVTTTGNPPITGYAKSAVNVRNAPGGSVLGVLPLGNRVNGVLVGNMVRFTYKGQTAYVYVSMLQATPVQVTRYIYANSIIRSAPNGSAITTLKMPLFVQGTIEGAWLKFTYNGNDAYVANSVTTTDNPPITGYAKSAVNVRNAPGGSVLGVLPLGNRVNGVLAGNMVRFTYKGQTAYVYVSMLQATPVQVTCYIYANSIIRGAPNGEEITTLWRPVLIKGTREGAWIKFNYNGSTAYVAAGVTTANNPPISGYINRTVNVRKTPGGIITHIIPIGFQVQGVLVGNNIKIHFNNETGYVDASFLQQNAVYMARYVAANSIIRTKPKPLGRIIEISEQTFLAENGYIKDKWFHFTYQKGYIAYSACVELSSTVPTLSHQHNWRSVYKKEKISDGYFKDTIIMALDVSDPEYGNGETLPVGVQEYGGIAYYFATGYIAKSPEDMDIYDDYCFANDISTQHGNYVPSIEWDGVRDKPTIPWTIYVKEPQYLESIDYVCECGAIK
ncbi:MAG: hypothetical protein ACOX3H_10525 [Saccharofermentanales bacterium]|jgi:hypothetical protein